MVALALRRLAGIALHEVLYADDGQQNETVTVSTLLAKNNVQDALHFTKLLRVQFVTLIPLTQVPLDVVSEAERA